MLAFIRTLILKASKALDHYKSKLDRIVLPLLPIPGIIFTAVHILCFALRYTAQQLLEEPFFTESCGIRVELASRRARSDGSGDQDDVVCDDGSADKSPSTLVLQLVTDDCHKYKEKHKGDECLQFDFDLNVDTAVGVAKDMVSVCFCGFHKRKSKF